MNVLITGGAGFIGSNLSLELLNRGYKVTVLDNLLSQVHGEIAELTSPLFKSIKNKVNFIKGDVTNNEDWSRALEKQDVIVHLAAETGTGQSMYKIGKYTDVNVSGTAKMLDILVNNSHQVKKIIVASSRAVYGEGKYLHPELGVVYPETRKLQDMENGDFEVKYYDGIILQPLSTDENSRIKPTSVYGITKYNQEQMVLMVCKALRIPAVALRYQNVYGEGQSLSNPYTGILSIFSSQILNGNDINIFEDGKESRDFVHIEDVVNVTISCLENNNIENDVFNVGTGVPITVLEVAKQLNYLYKKNTLIEITKQFRIGDIRHNFANIEKIKTQLNYEPKISFKEGVSRFANWVLEQDISESKLQESLDEMRKKGLLK